MHSTSLAPSLWKPIALLCAVLVTQGDLVAGPALNEGPTSRDHRIAIIVSTLLPRMHISHRKLDDTVGQRALDLFIESLDPRKLYFVDADIDEFTELSTQLDDLVRAGNVEPAYRIFRRFVQRISERMDIVNELLDGEFDFTIDEVADLDPDFYPKSIDEVRDRWRRELKLQLLFMEASDAKEGDQRSTKEGSEFEARKTRLRRRYRRLESRMRRLESDQLFERYMAAFSRSYDPHTTYMSASTLDQFMIEMSLNLEGIGAELREEDGHTSISRIMDGGAASRETSIRIGDKILAVGQGLDGEWEDSVGMPVADIASRVRGKPGTVVRLKLMSTVGDIKEVRLVRSRVELSESRARGHIVPLDTDDGEAFKAGYVELPAFYRDVDAMQRGDDDFHSCSRDVRDLLMSFRRQSADAVVLDLRDNGGGYLDEAIRVVGLFIDLGPVAQVRSLDGAVQIYEDREAGAIWDGPLVVLTNTSSASASEIVAGAIQNYRRGVIVGDRQTHGKGTVQTPLKVADALFGNVQELPNYGALKVTVQKYYLPDGESTQIDGVSVDIALPSANSYAGMGERALQHTLPKDRVPAANHALYEMSTASLVNQLRDASRRRVGFSESFAQITRQMEAARESRDRKTMPVMKSKFQAIRERLQAGYDPSTNLEGESRFPNDDYEEEVLEIVHDYVNALGKRSESNA